MTATRLAGDAAEAIRQLNHATRSAGSGLAYPADAYDIVGELSLMAARLPQALSQLLSFVTTEASAGRIVIAAGPQVGDPAAVLTALTAEMDAAVLAARRLQQALDAAHTTLTWAAAAEN
jgi:hypothetical protein